MFVGEQKKKIDATLPVVAAVVRAFAGDTRTEQRKQINAIVASSADLVSTETLERHGHDLGLSPSTQSAQRDRASQARAILTELKATGCSSTLDDVVAKLARRMRDDTIDRRFVSDLVRDNFGLHMWFLSLTVAPDAAPLGGSGVAARIAARQYSQLRADDTEKQREKSVHDAERTNRKHGRASRDDGEFTVDHDNGPDRKKFSANNPWTVRQKRRLLELRGDAKTITTQLQSLRPGVTEKAVRERLRLLNRQRSIQIQNEK